MLPSLILGFLAVVLIWTFLGWYARAKTEEVKRSLRWTAVILGLLVIGLLIVTGRFAAAMAGLMGLAGWAWRAFNVIQMGRQFTGMFRNMAGGTSARAAGPQTSTVDAGFVRMTLDHDSGAMDGQVLKGTFAGRKLSAMNEADVLALRAESGGDADSLALIETYLDRSYPDWRNAQQEDQAHGGSSSSTAGMTRDEAFQILGLQQGAGEDEIKAAYRRLMAQMHPDRGGSDYLAAKINAAKDFLLKS